MISRNRNSENTEDAPTPSNIDPAWLAEIDKRIAEVNEGKVELIPYEQFPEEMKREFGW